MWVKTGKGRKVFKQTIGHMLLVGTFVAVLLFCFLLFFEHDFNLCRYILFSIIGFMTGGILIICFSALLITLEEKKNAPKMVHTAGGPHSNDSVGG